MLIEIKGGQIYFQGLNVSCPKSVKRKEDQRIHGQTRIGHP